MIFVVWLLGARAAGLARDCDDIQRPTCRSRRRRFVPVDHGAAVQGSRYEANIMTSSEQTATHVATLARTL